MRAPDDPLLVTLTAGQLRELLAESVADALGQGAADQALDLAQLRERFGFTRESLASAARNGLAVHRGPKGRVMAFRADVEGWIRSRAWSPSSRQHGEPEDDALARAERELLAGDGSGTRRGQPKAAARGATPETGPHASEPGDQESRTYGRAH